MSEFKVGDSAMWNGEKFTVEALQGSDGLIVKSLERDFKTVISKRNTKHACEKEIAAGHRIDNDMGDDSHIENHISPLCKSKDV